ncbi:rhodanese-like domain-containing protein [Arthrobacter sp. NPDC056691]|uniref:rhodanese-like domain-containing protein n=1 Tax=Arthrobacter sp. NPDC056691 TaxID=3345913 RepID=UPI003670FD96
MSTENTTLDPQLVSADEAARLIGAGALLIDVRSDKGRASTGSVPAAVVVDRENVAQDFGPESPARLTGVTGTDQQIVVFCGSVNGSRPVAEKLKLLGYSRAVHVDGGFPALRDAGVPATGPTVEIDEPAQPAAV